MGLPMPVQMMGKFSLNQIPTINHKFVIVNSFIIVFIQLSIRRKSLSYESFGGLLYMLGDL